MYDIIIIGSGPAGMTAAIYASRNNKKTLLLEANVYGGQIINTPSIENYPVEESISGYDFASKLFNQVKHLGTEIQFERVTQINNNNDFKEVITSKNTYKTKSIIIATGAKNRLLGLENEKEFVGKGISYCATCDGAFYKNKEVAIVGGGNTAFEDAIYLSNIVNKLYLIHRRKEFRSEQSLVDELKSKKNVEFILDSNITSLNGNDKLESVTVKNNDGIEKEIKVSGLFVAIGRTPENEIFKGLINMDENGYIISSEDCHTNIDGIFVSGDNRTKSLRQLVTATSDGAIAATEAIKYVNNN